MNQYDVDGSIYQVPGSMMIRTMAYNKTLFEEKGWEAPTNHQELVKLVKQIRAESNITPIGFASQGLGYHFTTMTTYAQAANLADAAGWLADEENYLSGLVSSGYIFQSGIDMLQQLIDAGAYDIDAFIGCWDPEAIDKFIARDCAMLAIWDSQSDFADKAENSADEFVLIPFYNEEGDAFLGTNIFSHVGLAKVLGDEGNEKKLENALRVMEWLATPEGMSYMHTGNADIMPLVAADNEHTAKIYKEVWEANLNGMKGPMLYTGYEDIIVPASEFIMDAMRNRTSLDGLVELIDAEHQKKLHAPEAASLGAIAERFSHDETVQLMAEVLQSAGLSDITLVSSGDKVNNIVNYAGVHGNLYEGYIYSGTINICLPGGGQNNPVQILSLTGAQIIDLIENGKTISDDMEEGKNAVFRYFWAGMTVDMEKGKVNTITLDKGTVFSPESVYTVAFSQGDYSEEIEASGNPVAAGVGCQDLFKKYLENNDQISPSILK